MRVGAVSSSALKYQKQCVAHHQLWECMSEEGVREEKQSALCTFILQRFHLIGMRHIPWIEWSILNTEYTAQVNALGV